MGWKLLGRPLRANVHLQIQATSAFSLWLKAPFCHHGPYFPKGEPKQMSPLSYVKEEREVAFVLRKVQMGCRLGKFLAMWLLISPADWNLASGYVIVRISCWD